MNEATIARDEAIARVEGNADVLFMNAAANAIEQAAKTMPEFTTDDVEPLCMISAREPRAWGAAMMKAAKAGMIEQTDRIRRSNRKQSHCRPKQVWISKIYEAPKPAAGLFEVKPVSSYGSI